jgi:hypothetical protein
VGTAWRYRLFRVGRMPPALRSASRASDVLVAFEGVSVKISGRSIALPGVRSVRSVQLNVGSFVLSPGRILASIGAWTILDWNPGEQADTGHTLSFSDDGLHLHVSVPELYEGGRGVFELHFRMSIPNRALAQLPTGSIAVSLPEGLAPLAKRWA